MREIAFSVQLMLKIYMIVDASARDGELLNYILNLMFNVPYAIPKRLLINVKCIQQVPRQIISVVKIYRYKFLAKRITENCADAVVATNFQII